MTESAQFEGTATRFLEICGPVGAAGEARIAPRRYSRWAECLPFTLLLEGLHQFAVRLAYQVTGRSPEIERLLPAAIKSLDVESALEAEEWEVRGSAIPFGPTVRVRAAARRAGLVADEIRAELVVAVAGRTGGRAVETRMAAGVARAPLGPTSLFTAAAARSSADLCAFCVNAEAPLLAEHFPGFPVAPGSLVLGRVAQSLGEKLGSAFAWRGLRDVQFVRPVTPGPVFSCRLTPSGPGRAARGIAFNLIDDANRVAVRGVFDVLEPPRVHPAETTLVPPAPNART